MKIKQEHFSIIQSSIKSVLESYPNLVGSYEAGQFHKSDKVTDLQKRFCFDVFSLTNLPSEFMNELYNYLNDDHIYSALKKICPKVSRKY